MTARSTRSAVSPGVAATPTPTPSNVVPTPEAFAAGVRAILAQHKGDMAHRVLDAVVTTLLTSLGYGEGMAIFLEAVAGRHSMGPGGSAEARATVTALDLPKRRANVEALRGKATSDDERWICDEFVRLFDTIEALNALLAEDGQ